VQSTERGKTIQLKEFVREFVNGALAK
jgi:hypothetical protein